MRWAWAFCLVLVACGNSLAAAPTCAQRAMSFVTQAHLLAREWDAVTELANNSPRAQLPAHLARLRALHQRADAIDAPACAAAAKQQLILAMETTEQTFVAFAEHAPEDQVRTLSSVSNRHRVAFQEAMDQLLSER